ncbi:unnamed protein product [Dibothriocephalus latus]|uniref:SAM domain-containing protein n=1 Tax=Dibothriocephalus latus TaxID=60516 RepID=A0A3P7NW25_DIBLA|nr:unnamed protein product [Dibothriocephalus latus]
MASVCDFLSQLGLGYCAAAARTWVRTGADIITATTKKLEQADLQSIGITSELHMLSLRRGLQLLRQINFDLSQLSRRPVFRTPEPVKRLSSTSPLPSSEASAGEDVEEEDVFKAPARGSLPPKAEAGSRRATSPVLSTLPSRSPLIRCLGELSSAKEGQNNPQRAVPPSELVLWTFHRLEVWLRDIELPEYVSNLQLKLFLLSLCDMQLVAF